MTYHKAPRRRLTLRAFLKPNLFKNIAPKETVRAYKKEVIPKKKTTHLTSPSNKSNKNRGTKIPKKPEAIIKTA